MTLAFPKRQILDSTKRTDFAGENFKFDERGGKFSKRVENTVGNGAISPSPIGFSEDFFCRHVKSRACLGKG